MRKSTLATILVAGLLIAGNQEQAWNGPGHITVAKIAYDQLYAKQKVAIAKLLQHHPHYKSLLLKGKPSRVSEAEWAFVKAATWPDMVRS